MKPDLEIYCPNAVIEDIVLRLMRKHRYPPYPEPDDPAVWINTAAPDMGRPIYRYAFVVDGVEPRNAPKPRRPGDPGYPRWVTTPSSELDLTIDMMMHEIAEDVAIRLTVSDGTS